MKNRTSSIIATSRLFVCLMFVTILSWGTSDFAQNSTIFGPNVYVFTPGDSVSSINSTLSTLASYGQFDTRRAAVLFQPGTYTGVESEVGFYESIAGLGQTPSAVNLNQSYLESNETINGNDTQTFWRSMENMEMTTPGSGTLQWGVSQGASVRRMLINNSVELTDSGCNYSSGGFIANTRITGQVNSCSQQQWYTRNSALGSWTGGNWNMVFSGVSGAPAQSNPFGGGGSSHTVLATTPVSREKPFLYMDSSGNYWVFSPTYGTNTSGITWGNGGVGSGEAGASLPISSFLIATPSTSLATINSALSSGDNLILTPGIYQYSGSINVTNANTVVLGLGYADLVPQSGTAALTVADVGGVQLAGFLIDAGPVNSPALLQVGVKGVSRVSHATNPTTISDVHFRIGGATLGTCTTATEIDSDNVIIDNMWSWRADHGNGGTVGWTANVCKSGLVVNGDNVLATGLAVEHYEGRQVEWTGENGETIFYQSEMPYDVPSQSAWNDENVDGYASYNVASTVANHVAYGLGIYSVFDQGVNIIANSGIAAPVADGVTFHDMVTVTLASGQINFDIASNNDTVDNGGSTATSYLTSWGGANGNCGSAPGTPGTPSGSGTSTSTMNVTWGASSEGSNCTLSYNLFRSTASGFTPSSSNMIASDLTSASFIDSGLASGTTYFYVAQAVDAAGSSANSAQGSGTTTGGGGSCTAVPSAPTGLAASGTSSSGTTLTWTTDPPPANCSISSYTVLENGSSIGSATGTSFAVTGLSASTTYSFTLKATDSDGTSPASSVLSVTTLSGSGGEGPFGGTPAEIPGTVLAENYDTGGQGVAYNVTTNNGSDNAYRSDGVDLELASSPATGNDIGWTTAGQWFRYTVNVTTAGTYTVTFEVATESVIADAFHLSNSAGANLSGSIAVPNTGGWQTWTAVTATVTLPAGTQTLTLNQDTAGWNIDSATFVPANAPYGGTPAAIPGTMKAENYDTGGQGVGYSVTSINGTDNSYRSDGVDLETTSATGGGNDLGWTTSGQWFKYTVNVATAGTYTVTFEVAAPTATTDAFHLSNSSGTNLTGSVNVSATGGWQTWTTVTATVTLPAGLQVLTLDEDNGGWNIDYATFAVQ